MSSSTTRNDHEEDEFLLIVTSIGDKLKKQPISGNLDFIHLYADLLNNLGRCINLLFLYHKLKITPLFSSDPALKEILLNSVVFMHATCEELLRRSAIMFSITAGDQALAEIPISCPTGKKQKIQLSDLLAFQGVQVNDILDLSVKDYYDRSNFNNTREISILLRILGISPSNVSSHFSELEIMFNFRHLIVHRLGKTGSPVDFDRKIQNIEDKTVAKWLEAVVDFCIDVINELSAKYSTQ